MRSSESGARDINANTARIWRHPRCLPAAVLLVENRLATAALTEVDEHGVERLPAERVRVARVVVLT